jgi:purine nucleosidase
MRSVNSDSNILRSTIVDGDWGGDEFQLAAVALANRVELLGATATFGNVSQAMVFQNAIRILEFLKADDVKLFRGASAPSDREQPLLGDGAHPVIEFLPEPTYSREEQQNSVDFILETLYRLPPGTVNITASGPLTNIAQALREDRDTMMKVGEIIVMGGCTVDMVARDIPLRRGNITKHAEFNFQQAASDAKFVMQSGLPITLLPMNCTHQLTLTPARHSAIRQAFEGEERALRVLLGTEPVWKGELLAHEADPLDLGLLNAPARLDMQKFGIDPVMHDVNCALYMLYPEQYELVRGRIDVSVYDGIVNGENMWDLTQGRTEFFRDESSNLQIATSIKDPDFLFGVVADSLSRVCR